MPSGNEFGLSRGFILGALDPIPDAFRRVGLPIRENQQIFVMRLRDVPPYG